MKNEELLIGKTIVEIDQMSIEDSDAIVLTFSDGTCATITTNASDFMYGLYIDEYKK
jgi:hypothetical protein